MMNSALKMTVFGADDGSAAWRAEKARLVSIYLITYIIMYIIMSTI